jgi:Ca2+-binding EF-hand superfamily protein
MKYRHTLLATGLLAATATLAAFAASAGEDPRAERMQQHEQRADAAFAESDSNHDGRLSQSEWQSARLRDAAEKFKKLDLNRDGNLSREEMREAREQHRGKRGEHMREKLQGMDADGDQQLSRAEIADKAPRLADRFDTLDTNADGKLSREELRAGRPSRGDDAQR